MRSTQSPLKATLRAAMLSAGAITLALIASLAFAQAPAPNAAALGKFTGTWKENESKRKMSPSASLKFRRDAEGNLEELRGSEAHPVVQSVRFDGKPHDVGALKNRIAWKQIDKNHFERSLFSNGKLVTTRRIQISEDGKTLTEETERTLTDGKNAVITAQFRRTTGEPQGLAAVWQPVSYHSTIPQQMKFEATRDRLKVSTDTGLTFAAALDGKPVAVTGPSVSSGRMIALKQVDSQTIETAESREGVSTSKGAISISADGKVMTLTEVDLASGASREPSVTVLEKQ
jgi:hypothetical protein